MKQWYEKHRPYITTREFLIALGMAFLLFILSVVVNFHASTYATQQASNAVTDIILSNTPVIQVHGLFVYGPIIFWVGMVALCFYDPRKIPFTVKSIALFILIRSVFVSLTHIGPFPERLEMSSTPLTALFNFGGDFFFSGHTGLPFLMALIFWSDRPLRYACIMASVLFGVVVLLAHQHYTIDVLAAFFITYTIFHIAEWLFEKDRQLFFRSS